MRISKKTIFVTCALWINTITSYAELGDTIPQQFTYHGRLELDGAPQTGDFDMMFSLTKGEDSPVPNSGFENGRGARWWEKYEGENPVHVSNGNFTVVLGSQRPFSSFEFFGGEQFFARNSILYLETKVKPAGAPENAWVTLSPKQQLLPVPYAIAASKGSEFRAEGIYLEDPENVDRAFADKKSPLTIRDSGGGLMKFDANDISSFPNRLDLQKHSPGTETRVHGPLVAKQAFTAENGVIISGGALTANNGLTINGNTTFNQQAVFKSDPVFEEGMVIEGDMSVQGANIELDENTTISGPLLNIGTEVHLSLQGWGGGEHETRVAIMEHSNSSFCFLTRTVTDDVHDNEFGGCDIDQVTYRNSGEFNPPVDGNGNIRPGYNATNELERWTINIQYWVLKAYAHGRNTTTWCSVRCVQW